MGHLHGQVNGSKNITTYICQINNDLDIEFNKKRRDTKLTTRRFEDILSSLSSDRKNSVLKFNILTYRIFAPLNFNTEFFLSLDNEDKMSSKRRVVNLVCLLFI